ncbi:EAL domain-containing protein [uncultured Cohaesibacter sp.]|uniref:sensor domain-containing protein n=1 Tax=uncultured Cohaesibacter sp. TaxID=1002546 RepID=UPI002931E529|nr:EAL domain-containing protein [uncultured Cohaesibacter sp.]
MKTLLHGRRHRIILSTLSVVMTLAGISLIAIVDFDKSITVPPLLSILTHGLIFASLLFLLFLRLAHQQALQKARELEETQGKLLRQAENFARQKVGIDAHAIISITNRDGRITYANDKFCEISGYSQEELIGEDHRILNSGIHDQTFFSGLYANVLRGKTWHGEICNRAKDGSLYWVATTIVPLQNQDGRVDEFISIRTDITSIKSHEAELQKSNQLLDTTFKHFPGSITAFDKDKRLILANRATYDLLETSPEDLPVGSTYEDIVRINAARGEYGSVEPDEILKERLDLLKSNETIHFDRINPAGRHLEISMWPLQDGGFVVVHLDATDRYRMIADLKRKNEEAEATAKALMSAQAAQKETHQRLLDSINSMKSGFAIWDKESKLLMVNEAFRNFHEEIEEWIVPGLSFERFMQLGAEKKIWQNSDEMTEEWIKAAHRKFISNDEMELIIVMRDGTHLILYNSRLENGDAISNFIDITEDRKRQAELERARDALTDIAYFDALTTLPNRAHCQQDLEQMFKDGKPRDRFAIIQIDIDKFKRVNDSMGHISGDHLLKEIGSRLSFLASKVPTFKPYRWGGDEFVATVTNISSEELESLCQELTDLIAIPVPYEGATLWPTVSLGIALYPDDATDLASLMMYADLALYKTKEMGRDGYQFFSAEMKEKLDSEASIEADVRAALRLDEFELYFQPQISTIDESITGIEALVRWNHPERGQLPPGLFMEIVESNGMASALGNVIFDKAMMAVRSWSEEGLHFGRLSVNLSPAHLKKQTLVDDFCYSMEKYGVNPDLLAVELLESMLLDDRYTYINELFETLAARGVHVELDDFGTGYASLSHLSNLPVDGIKIDRSFVNNIAVNEKQKAIVEVVMSMSKMMQLRVVCEGIETHQQLSTVSQIANCSVQGYLVSRPLCFNDMTNWIREKRHIGLLSPSGPRQIRHEHLSIAPKTVISR